MKPLEIVNAREHNLKNLTLTIPPQSLTVFTGVSGSGKSSLAFDTIYAESQRRYIESFSVYARQFLARLERPAVDAIRGLSPSISIEQKTTHRNPRSTVGTVTEVYDYLRLLYAAVGKPHCPTCRLPIQRQSPEAMAEWVLAQPPNTRLMVLAPLARQRKGAFRKELESVLKRGFPRVRIDGEVRALDEEDIRLDQRKAHDIEVVVDRLVVRPGLTDRLRQAIGVAVELSRGTVLIALEGQGEMLFSTHLACPACGFSLPALEPRSFSFNSRFGACPTCDGLGVVMDITPEEVIEDVNGPVGELRFRVRDGLIVNTLQSALQAVARHYDVSPTTPFGLASPAFRAAFFHGTEEKLRFQSGGSSYRMPWVGVANYLRERRAASRSARLTAELQRFVGVQVCPDCQGARLRAEARAVTVNGQSLGALTRRPLTEVAAWAQSLAMTAREAHVAAGIVAEIQSRLAFLVEVGLGYLTLDRPTATLSGGEIQRVRLATQLGTPLRGVLYILDEPSIGLHPRDNQRLIHTLERLRDAGNTVIVVEHDEETILRADWVIDLGPGAGTQGGHLVVAGPPGALRQCPDSLTGQYLAGVRQVVAPRTPRPPSQGYVTVVGATHHNLREVTARFPVGCLTVVTGVSGAGKSSLVLDVLYRALVRQSGPGLPPGAHRGIEGAGVFDKVIEIDQSPIGRTPRSNPATYTGVFTPIRDLYASLPGARARGYRPGRFSFNVAGGRCEACEGDGVKRIEMAFLPDVYVPCEVCQGRRYNRETLEVLYEGRDIARTLDMTVTEAAGVFAAFPPVAHRLRTLVEVGLGYLTLGQPATTLSGGEAQRLKLACELARRATGRTLYILDEPTTGLHFEDVRRLLEVLQALVERGNTVIVIEHHTDVMWAADWIVDLGPEGGAGGGRLVGEGPPARIASLDTPTGRALAQRLAASN
ncbi:excinuclease ABC subunit UvrA [Chloracidobacterium sp. MS 40/45]|uniref:excinuclease ABC subunit UvrA n=1 Tax=Chloracidobacterium aggregatum TaxID=2851959 RepID=UPI001B8C9459|nr:excinuclease ABC subunit UvrA [Chloracidobacterium aggregatum]QUV99002.1 excinuclease ABC subunit UvrA [Chloracidobacterium sp. MS 40/45]